MSTKSESGLRNHRVEFVRENVDANGDPVTPSDPAFERPSDRVYSIEWGPSPGLQADRGLSDVDADEHDKGPEEHELTVAYALQRWFVDANGNPSDLAGDGVLRDADGLLPNTHTFVDREDKGTVAAASTVEGQENGKSGATGKATRIYTVAKGAKVGEVTLTVDPGDQQPARTEVTYQAEKVRRYQVDQPTDSANGELGFVSTSANDTTQTVTVEDEGATTTEDVALNGTTTVWTSSTFSDIDALDLDAETEGDIEVYQNAGTSTSPAQGELLAVLDGSSSYDGIEGDLGIPALGAGSHAGSIGTDYLRTLTDSITLAGSSDYWFEINSKELSVDNNLDTQPRDDSVRMRIQEGIRNVEMAVTTYGETQSYSDARRALQNTGANIKWSFPNAPTGNGDIDLNNAKLTDPGIGPYEAEESQMTIDETFVPEGGGTSGLSIA